MMDSMLGFCKGTDYLEKSGRRKRYKKEEEVTGLSCTGSFFFMVLFECSIFDGQFICHTVHT